MIIRQSIRFSQPSEIDAVSTPTGYLNTSTWSASSTKQMLSGF